MKKTAISFFLLLLCSVNSGKTQEPVVSIDTVPCMECESEFLSQPTSDPYRIVTNRFRANWFVLGNVGAHAFFGDYGSVGKFSGLLSPDINIGVGKWFTPGIGAKLQFGISDSRSFSKEETSYTYGNILTDGDGAPYWKSKMKWIDLNLNAVFNISRLVKGYEGLDSDKLKNQFIASLGIGILHHYGIPEQRNEWSGHVELQYSRFFNQKKDFSFDVKARAMLYQTNFDAIVIKKAQERSRWFDLNVGLSVGFTYHFKKRHWDRCQPAPRPVYNVIHPIVTPATPCPEYGTLIFYVFFPNNYSGRNDAPALPDAPVNAIDYLASGVFTQTRFSDSNNVTPHLASKNMLSKLKTLDVPTQKISEASFINGVHRGYEMSNLPISLCMSRDSLLAFKEVMGYYYAPIYKGGNTWYYRVDHAAADQRLLDKGNYKESHSYALNSHCGLSLVKSCLPIDFDGELYSFADVYGALDTAEGNVALAADSGSIDKLNKIFDKGRIISIIAEGAATSQDNYSGRDAESVGMVRNRELAYNRAYTVVSWLRNTSKLKNVPQESYVINALLNPVVDVDDESTRELNAKLHRCVKVKINYVME